MPVGNGPEWTDERVTVLEKLWNDGLSASRIASHLGWVTRNAVIGKVRRLGLDPRDAALTRLNWSISRPRAEPKAPQPKPPRVRAVTAPRVPPAPKPAKAANVVDFPAPPPAPHKRRPPADEPPLGAVLHLDLADLGPGQCRWPFGDGPFTFCGCPTADRSDPDLRYCPHHAYRGVQHAAPKTLKGSGPRPDLSRSKPGRSELFRQAAGKGGRW